MTSQQTSKRHPSSDPQPESLNGLVGIDRTRRQMTAIVADKRRERVPVNPDQRAPRMAWQPRHGA